MYKEKQNRIQSENHTLNGKYVTTTGIGVQ